MLRHLRPPGPAKTGLWARALATAAVPKASPGRAEPEPLPIPMVPSRGRSHWKTTESVPLTRESMLDLLYGMTPLIKEPGFLSPSECFRYEKELSRFVTPYAHNTGPTMRRVGIAQFEYQAQSQDDLKNRSDEQERYFADAHKWAGFHRKLADEKGLDAWFRVIDRIAALFPDWDVEVAAQGGRTYFSGIFRALNDSTFLHCDFSPYDSLTEDWIINSVECQAVFNLFLAPVKDGNTIVHDVQWTEDVLRFRHPDSYGYHYDLVRGAQKVVCEPTVGALCMFNSRNMHEVEAVTPEPMPELGMQYRPRLSLSSFMGLLPSSKTGGKPRLIFWS